MPRPTVAIVGAGTWGLALAAAAARTGGETLIFSRKKQSSLPPGVRAAAGLHEVGEKARLLVLAVPSSAAQAVCIDLGDHVDGRHLLVHGVRGLAGETMTTVSGIVRETTPARRVGALGGPVLPDELTANKPSVMVCGSPFPEVNDAIIEAFGSETLRIYPTLDLKGLEWASALVGCLAILVGYIQEAGLEPGLLAAIITGAVLEAGKLIEGAGGQERTMLGFAGYGDLLAAVSQQGRPEVILGRSLAKGRPLAEAMAAAKLRVEAVELIPRVTAWAESQRIPVPVLRTVSRGLFGGATAEDVVRDLMQVPVSRR